MDIDKLNKKELKRILGAIILHANRSFGVIQLSTIEEIIELIGNNKNE